jgi:hypothetical protein
MRFELQVFDTEYHHVIFNLNFIYITRDKCYINSERSYIIITFRYSLQASSLPARVEEVKHKLHNVRYLGGGGIP